MVSPMNSVSKPALLTLLSFGGLAEVGRIAMTCKHLAGAIAEQDEAVFVQYLTPRQVGDEERDITLFDGRSAMSDSPINCIVHSRNVIPSGRLRCRLGSARRT
jgi:hypothetical protein